MRSFLIFLVVTVRFGYTSPVAREQKALQAPSWDNPAAKASSKPRKLHGRFLHITDLHADPFYKIHASTEEEAACHRGKGAAGIYGAETSDCDSPYALINETFKWIENNLRDTIDFVVWTGDSARHDSDENIPRSSTQVLDTNKYIAGKFAEVFGTGKPDGGQNEDLIIPIVPNFGNNDILPHNIMVPGPNKWLKNYNSVWKMFIPEEQRHLFQRGGWFYVEVIPRKLAVFSLNTLFFFDSNSAVDGCALKSEPGFEQMEWLRIQLGLMRERGMKVILMGHVPPARTESKQLWDETCWQKYTLWLRQYRDVVIAGLYGHMNVDHFILQDTRDIDLVTLGADVKTRTHLDDEFTTESAADYLEELREHWSKLPDPTAAIDTDDFTASKKKKRKGKKSKKHKALKKIGGPWGERFQMTSVSPSVVPNFFPTIRVIEYNLTGLENTVTWFDRASLAKRPSSVSVSKEASEVVNEDVEDLFDSFGNEDDSYDLADSDVPLDKDKKNKKKKKPKKPKNPKNPDLVIPPPPSKGSPPGPAYSPQPLTLVGYTQYFANLTYINNDYNHDGDSKGVENFGWHGGKHKNKPPKEEKPHPKNFKYEIEYSTFNDSEFNLPDMTVKSYLKLAHTIGKHEGSKKNSVDWTEWSKDSVTGDDISSTKDETPPTSLSWVDMLIVTIKSYAEGFGDFSLIGDVRSVTRIEDVELNMSDKHKKHKKEKKHDKKKTNRTWLAFIKRAFVGTMTDNEIEDTFELAQERAAAAKHIDYELA